MNDSTPDTNSTLESVRGQFDKWRSSRANNREPIPDDLWQAAARLCKTHSISHVCRCLRLSFTDLKRHVSHAKPRPAQFVEIDMKCLAGGWQLQCERADGAKLRLLGSGQLAAINALLREFLS